MLPTAEDDLEGLPLPLRQLISTTGVQLVPAPCGTWNIDGYAAKLRRPLSVTFSIDSIVTSEEVLEAVAGAGVGVEEIASIQYRGSNRSWCVSFTTRAAKDRILERGIIKCGNVSVFVGDADFKTVIVKIYEAPPEMPDTVVIGRLSHYGRVLSFRRDVGLTTGFSNGVRTARMRFTKAIRSSVRIAGEAVFVSYSGQPKTCRRCGEEGHLAQGCRKPRCYNCEAPGHVASDCDLDPLCGVCLQSGHHVSDCPYLILSANVQVNASPSYADIARPIRPASPVAPPSADQQQRKRKADREQSRSITPDHSRDVEGREKVRRRDALRDLEERRHHDREDRPRDREYHQRDQDDRPRDREDRHRGHEDHEDYHREERREDHRRERDRERESERERRREADRPREHSSRDRGGNRDRRRSPNHDPHHDHSPQLYSSDSDSDGRHHERRRSRKSY